MYLLSSVVMKPHLLAAHQDHSCRSGPIPPCLSARHLVSLTHTGLQHRCLGPLCMCASVFARKSVCVCVCVCAPPASPQQDCQSVCDYTPTHLRLFCFLTIPSPLPLASIFAARPFAVFNILIKSAMFHTGE